MNPLSIATRFVRQVELAPSRTAFRFLERGETETASITYEALDRRARGVASALLDRAAPRDRMLLVFEPGPEFIAALMGCLYAGIVAIPAPAPRAGATLERLEGIVRASRAPFLLTSRAIAEAGLEAALPGIELLALEDLHGIDAAGACPGFGLDPQAPIVVQYTSGSTLDPRGVILTSACIGANVDFSTRGIDFASGARDEVVVNWMPHYHDMGLFGGFLIPMLNGAEAVHMAPLAFVQHPARWLQAIHRYKGTMSGGPPLAYDLCAARVPEEVVETLDLSSWYTAFCGAEPVFAASLAAFRRRFARARLDPKSVYAVYGLAEVGVYAAGSHWPSTADRRPAATEREPSFLDEEAVASIRIVSPAGRLLPQGQEGEIWISGPSVAAGYLDDEQATAATFRNRLDPDDGRLYLRTGDLGSLADGTLSVSGRIKDVLIRNGANIAAADVERIATQGRPQLNGHAAAAFQTEGAEGRIVLLIEKSRGPWDAAEEPKLLAAVRRSVSDALSLQLDAIRFLEPGMLPRTTSGKVQRARARAEWEAQRPQVPEIAG